MNEIKNYKTKIFENQYAKNFKETKSMSEKNLTPLYGFLGFIH